MSGCGTSCSLTLEILATAFLISLQLLILTFPVEKLKSKLKEFSISSIPLSSVDTAGSVLGSSFCNCARAILRVVCHLVKAFCSVSLLGFFFFPFKALSQYYQQF